MPDEGERSTVRELHERNRPPETTPVAVRLPKPLLDDIDGIWQGTGFETRSAFVRAVLQYVADNPGEFAERPIGEDGGAGRAFRGR